jgi:protein dispatched 1
MAILIHTRSPWLTLIGLAQIILSFPLAFFFYNVVLRLTFFPFLNFIGVFVTFALGADDVFVACDKWKNARLEYPKASIEFIAAKSLPDAAQAMFLTSVSKTGHCSGAGLDQVCFSHHSTTMPS